MLTCDGHGFETHGMHSVCCCCFFFFFLFFKGPSHILLNIIMAKPNPVHIRALRVQPIPYGFAFN